MPPLKLTAIESCRIIENSHSLIHNGVYEIFCILIKLF